ncbi:hypothetical protein SMZ96_000871 [Cronobacter muytjensii]|nr:hypothetical protein [Cronobacter muytjensii]
MTGFYLDAGELKALAERVGATERQMVSAYNRALKRTLAKYRKEALTLMLEQTGAKDKKRLQERVRAYGHRLALTATRPGTGKLWFGLNAISVSMLKGRIIAPEARERQRDPRGRFIPVGGARGVTFAPAATSLPTLSFPDSFVGIVNGRRSIWQRNRSNHFVKEAAVPVYGPANRAIRADLYQEMNDDLLKRFEQDLRGRIAGGVK